MQADRRCPPIFNEEKKICIYEWLREKQKRAIDRTQCLHDESYFV